MSKETQKNTTLNKVAVAVGGLTVKLDGLVDTVDNLAIAIANGFEGVEERLSSLEDGQEEVKLRLDNVAYRFEFKDLQQRVGVLEKRAGIRHK